MPSGPLRFDPPSGGLSPLYRIWNLKVLEHNTPILFFFLNDLISRLRKAIPSVIPENRYSESSAKALTATVKRFQIELYQNK